MSFELHELVLKNKEQEVNNLLAKLDQQDSERLKKIINLPWSESRRTRNGKTPLFIAVSEGYYSLIPILLKYGADPDIQMTDGECKKWSSFVWACAINDDKAVKLLLPKANILKKLSFLNSTIITRFKKSYSIGKITIAEKNSLSPSLNQDVIPFNMGLSQFQNVIEMASYMHYTETLELLLNEISSKLTPENKVYILSAALANMNDANLSAIGNFFDLFIKYGTNLDTKFEHHLLLFYAIKINRIGAVKQLIAKGANINLGFTLNAFYHITPFHAAVVSDDMRIIKCFLDSDQLKINDPALILENGKLVEYANPFSAITEKHCLEDIKLFIAKGANPLHQNKSNGPTKGANPISTAFVRDNKHEALEIATYLLSVIDKNLKSEKDKQTLNDMLVYTLTTLIQKNNLDGMKFLLSRKNFNINAALNIGPDENEGVTPLYFSIGKLARLPAFTQLINSKVDVNFPASFRINDHVVNDLYPLTGACVFRNFVALRKLIEAGANPFVENTILLFNPFRFAFKKDDKVILKELLATKKYKNGKIPLCYMALYYQAFECLKHLIEVGYDFSFPDPSIFSNELYSLSKLSPLCIAVKSQHSKLINYLVELNYSIDEVFSSEEFFGLTPLLFAILKNKISVINTILQLGANSEYIAVKGILRGKNAWNVALERAEISLYEPLLILLQFKNEFKADKLRQFREFLILNSNPLLSAILLEDGSLINFLLSIGADPVKEILKGRYAGETPYVVATCLDNTNILSKFSAFSTSFDEPIYSRRFKGLTLNEFIQKSLVNSSNTANMLIMTPCEDKEKVVKIPEHVKNISERYPSRLREDQLTYLSFSKEYLNLICKLKIHEKDMVFRLFKKLLFKLFHALLQYNRLSEKYFILNHEICNNIRNIIMHKHFRLTLGTLSKLVDIILKSNLIEQIDEITRILKGESKNNKADQEKTQTLKEECFKWIEEFNNKKNKHAINDLKIKVFKKGLSYLPNDISPIVASNDYHVYEDNIRCVTQTIIEFGEIFQKNKIAVEEGISISDDQLKLSFFFAKCKSVRDEVAHSFCNVNNDDKFDQIDPLAIVNLAEGAVSLTKEINKTVSAAFSKKV